MLNFEFHITQNRLCLAANDNNYNFYINTDIEIEDRYGLTIADNKNNVLHESEWDSIRAAMDYAESFSADKRGGASKLKKDIRPMLNFIAWGQGYMTARNNVYKYIIFDDTEKCTLSIFSNNTHDYVYRQIYYSSLDAINDANAHHKGFKNGWIR